MSLENGITSIKEELNEAYLGEIVPNKNTGEPEVDAACEKDERETKIENPRIVYCEMCANSFTSQHAIMAHMQIHLREASSEVPRYTCMKCKESFSERSSLYFHQRTHKVKKQHVCGKCGRRFTHLGNLQRHFKVHYAKKKNLACPECGKYFTLLAKHMRTHKSKTIKCETCGHLFADFDGLRHHMKIHTKPYVCVKCGKSFSRRLHLQSHERGHLGLANLDHCCFKCNAYFENFEDLGKHLKGHDV